MSGDQKSGKLCDDLEQYVRDLHQSRIQKQFFEQVAAENIVTTSCVAHQYGALMRLLINRGMNGTEAHTLLEKMHHGSGYGSWNVLQAYLENLQDAERRWAQGQNDPNDTRNRAERRRQARLNKRNKERRRK